MWNWKKRQKRKKKKEKRGGLKFKPRIEIKKKRRGYYCERVMDDDD